MEELVKQLEELMSFKDSTDVGDVVLIAGEEPQMLVYAYVSDIERDTSRRDEWWHVHLSLFSVPLQKVVWTLRTPQMSGMEIFTMGGEKRFIKAVKLAEKKQITSPAAGNKDASAEKGKGKILQFKRPEG